MKISIAQRIKQIPDWLIKYTKNYLNEEEAKKDCNALLKEYEPSLVELICIRRKEIPEKREPKIENLDDTAKIWEYFSENHRVIGKWRLVVYKQNHFQNNRKA